MPTPLPLYARVIDLIDELSLDEQKSLIQVVERRVAEEERLRIVASVRAAKKEHRQKKTRVVSPDELMSEILG